MGFTKRLFRQGFVLTLIVATWVWSSHSKAFEPPILVPVSSRDASQVKDSVLPTATIQVSFPTNMLEKSENVFAALLSKLPILFPDLKLNIIGRELHSTLLYLDDFSLADAQNVARFLSELDTKTLEDYDLLKPCHVFDPEHIELVVVGKKSKFIALKPHPDFIAWQMRFYRLIKDRAPWLLERHLAHHNLEAKILDGKNVHISLVQYGSRAGIDLSPDEEAHVITKLKEAIAESAREISRATQKNAQIQFSLKTHPINLVTAPLSIRNPPAPILSFKWSNSPGPAGYLSDVGRWQVGKPGFGSKRFVEFDTRKLIDDDAGAFRQEDDSSQPSWNLPPQRQRREDLARFKAKLSGRVRAAFKSSLRTLSPTQYPSESNGLYTMALTHPRQARQKANRIFEKGRKLGFRSTANVSVGLGTHGSAPRGDIDNPGDYDLLINGLVHVPSSVRTLEDAQKYAVRTFTREILMGQLGRAIRSKRLAHVEARIGSTATMGLPFTDIVTAFEDNPYLSEEEFLLGQSLDSVNEAWTLEERFALCDFTKNKVDLFDGDGRRDLSLQFVTGFRWRDPETGKASVYALQRNGLKGQNPLLRTAVYDGAESYAIAAAMTRQYTYYGVQKGPMIARTIRDLIKSAYGHHHDQDNIAPIDREPIWASKFAKKVYNFLIFLHQNEFELDRSFFEYIHEILKAQGDQTPVSIEEVVREILDAINQPELATLNAIRRILNDLSEYNERGWTFREDQWLSRSSELASHFVVLEKILRSDVNVGFEFTTAKDRFVREHDELRTLSVGQALKRLKKKSNFSIFRDFEDQIALLEAELISKKLKAHTKVLLQSFVGYLPHIYFEWVRSRQPEADSKLRWSLRFMGIEPSDANMKAMFKVSENLRALPRTKIAELQKGLFASSIETTCNLALDRLSDADFQPGDDAIDFGDL